MPLLHFGAVVGQSLSDLHATHFLSRQNGVAPAQFLSLVHWTQRSPSQTGVAPEQSALVRHAAHSPVDTLQIGAVAGQPAFEVQPARQVPSLRQMGVPAGQSALVRHWTQRPADRKQWGAAVPH